MAIPGEDYVNRLAQQLANQRKNLGTDKYYKGSIDSMGGIDTATQYMASLLNRSGIRDLSEIGEKIERVPQYAPKQNYYLTHDDIQKFNTLAASGRFGEEYVETSEGGGGYFRPKDPPVDEAVDVDGKKYFVKYGDYSSGDTGGRYGYLVPAEQTGTQINKTLINKRTGEQLKQGHDASYAYASTQNSYLDGEQADSDYTIGGSFAGGNTSLKVRLVDGVPLFYSTAGPSSSDFPKEAVAFGLAMASFAVPGLGAAVGGSITGALGITASAAVNAAIGTGVLTTLASGGDVKKGVISGLTSFVAPTIAAEIGKAAGNIFDSPMGQKMFTNMSAAAMRTAALGGNSDDIGKAVLGTATGEMFNVVASQIPGFSDIKDAATKAAISSSIQAALNTPGDLSEKAQAAMLQGSITMGLSELEIDGKKFNQLPPAQQSIARQALTSALTGQPLNEKAILNAALSAASKEVQASIKAEQKPVTDLAAYDASVGLTAPTTLFDDDAGFAFGSDFTAPGAAPPDAVLTAEAPSAGAMPSGLTAPRADSGLTPSMGGITDVLSPTGEIVQLGGGLFGQDLGAPPGVQLPFTEYASAATSDVPAQDISISQLPETMRPREGEMVTDATYGPEGDVRVTMVGKRPDGTEYSYTAVQDPEDKSVFYETASGGEAGGATRISDHRPGVEDKPAENVVIEGEDGSTVTLGPDGSVANVTDSAGTPEADQIFDAAEELRRAYDAELARGEQTIDLEDGSSVTLDKTGNVVEIVDPDGQVTDLRTDAAESDTGAVDADTAETGLDILDREIAADTADSESEVLEQIAGEDTTPGEAGADVTEGEVIERPAEEVTGERVEEEPERIARETAEELERQRAALTLPGEAGEDTLEPVEAEPEVDRAQIAANAGFPSEYLYDLYGGDIERYRQEEAEYAGFPDWDTYTQYAGDSTDYQNDLAVAEGWPDAATRDEFGTLERYQQHLKDQADLDAQGQAWEQQQKDAQDALNEELAQSNGFPDYATYLKFNGDQDAYLASLAPPVIEPEEPTEPVLEPPYTPGEDAEEFEPPVGVEPPYTPGEDAEEFVPPYIPGEDAEEFVPPVITEPPYTPGEDVIEFEPPYTPGEDAEEFTAPPEAPYTPGEDADEFVPPVNQAPYTPGEDAEEFVPPYTPGEDAGEFIPPYTPGEDAEGFIPPYTPGEDAAEFIPPYTPGEDAEEFIPPYTPGEDAEEFIPPYTPGEDAAEFEPEEEIDPETGLPRIKIPQPAVPPKQTVPPKKPITPLPPGLTPEQLMQFFGQLGAPGIMGALQPYEMPYYFQIPEEQQFDITEAFSPTLYRLQKE
jgi:hypothetical protein